jgi:hypothetical protein
MSRLSLGAAAAVLALGAFATMAEAAPIGGPATGFEAAAPQSSLAQKIASRHCWWQDGQRHCARRGSARVPAHRGQGSDYYEHYADKLPFGSQLWWDQMVREGRGGNGQGGGRN